MKKILVFFIIIFSVTACKKNNKTEIITNKTKSSALKTGCYSYQNNGDSIYMKIEKATNAIEGTLDISYAEKDASTGTFTGNTCGDTLFAVYTFYSEGVQSKREVVFLMRKTELLEGFGPMNTNGTRFKNRDSVIFSFQMPLKSVPCVD